MRALAEQRMRGSGGEQARRIGWLLVMLMLVVATSVMAGKNRNGALIVHTEHYSFYYGPCYDTPEIATCEEAVTQTDEDIYTPAMIWVFAAFPEAAIPSVTHIRFGLDHNLPQYYHNRWGFCGPAGTVELPEQGWPDFPGTAGNTIIFGSPVSDTPLLLFYYFDVWGYEGAYHGMGIHPTYGHAGFYDDSVPPVFDEVERFGRVRWYEPGYNECPEDPVPGACCLVTTECQSLLWLECDAAGGEFVGEGTVCHPNPCPLLPEACCFADGHCEVLTDSDCTGFGGVWLGPASACHPNPCPQPPEACCFPDGTCTYVPVPECEQAGGTPQGYGTNCELVACKPPIYGACCHDRKNFECVELTEDECTELPDHYLWIELEVCDPNPCTPVEAIEWTTWGGIKTAYR